MAEENVEYKRQVAKRRCQYRRKEDNHIVTADTGSVHDAPVGHPHFRPIGSTKEGLDFHTASEQELYEADWEYSEAEEFMYVEFGVTVRRWPEKSKRDWIRELLDARYRAVDKSDMERLDPGD